MIYPWCDGLMQATVSVYEYRTVELPRDASTDLTRAVLTECAEYGRWELDRHRIYADGRRSVRIRRRILRQARATLPGIG